MSYTESMKTAISVPDEIFEEADRLAERMEKSRSELYTDAVREYLARYDSESVTERLNEVVEDVSKTEDRFVSATTRGVLRQVDW